MGGAKGRDQTRVCPIGLGTNELTGTKGFDLRRIDHADGMACLVKIDGHGFPIDASSFHAHMK